ncbi:MAG: hypothetical protein WAU88_06080 [Candidatus Zixiibacteriota bacterium]
MAATGKLARRIPVVVAANLAAAAGGVLFQMFLSHRLEPSVFGAYVAITTFLYALCYVFEAYALTIAREYSTGRITKLGNAVLQMSLLLGLGTTCALVMYADGTSGLAGGDPWIWAIGGVSLFVWSLLWLLRGWVQGLQLEGVYVGNRSVELLARLGLGVLAFSFVQNLFWALVAGALGGIFAIGHLVISVRRNAPGNFHITREKVDKRHLVQFVKIALGLLPLALFIRLDMILAPGVLGSAHLGTYGVLTTVGKGVLLYSLAMSPLLFPYMVKSSKNEEWLRMLGFGCAFSTCVLGAVYLVFRLAGSGLVEVAFGGGYREAVPFMPMYLLALIPLAIHCNIINLQLAQGKTLGLVVSWVGLGIYYVTLRYVPESIGSYIGWMATVQGALSVAGLLTCFRLANSTQETRGTSGLESRVALGNGAVSGVEGIGCDRSAAQVQCDGQSSVGEEFGIRVGEQVPDAVVERDRISV